MAEEHFNTQFKDKLLKLNGTLQSIQSTSLWIVFHVKNYKQMIALWKAEVLKSEPEKQVHLLFLCNDVVQNSKKKTSTFVTAFAEVLLEVLQSIWKGLGDKNRRSISRIIDVWEQREIFSASYLQTLREIDQKDEDVPLLHLHQLVYGSQQQQLLENVHSNSVDNFVEKLPEFSSDAENLQFQQECRKKLEEFQQKRDALHKNNELREQYINTLREELKKQQEIQGAYQLQIQIHEGRVKKVSDLLEEAREKLLRKAGISSYGGGGNGGIHHEPRNYGMETAEQRMALRPALKRKLDDETPVLNEGIIGHAQSPFSSINAFVTGSSSSSLSGDANDGISNSKRNKIINQNNNNNNNGKEGHEQNNGLLEVISDGPSRQNVSSSSSSFISVNNQKGITSTAGPLDDGNGESTITNAKKTPKLSATDLLFSSLSANSNALDVHYEYPDDDPNNGAE